MSSNFEPITMFFGFLAGTVVQTMTKKLDP